MPRQNRVGNGLILRSSKIRKRACSLSSSPAPQNYRFKRAIFVGRTRESSARSSTPVPAWRTAANVDSLMGDRSVRKLVASLREMNDVPYPMVRENLEATKFFRRGSRVGSVRSGSLPCHLSDPSHRPVSEVDLIGYFRGYDGPSKQEQQNNFTNRQRKLDGTRETKELAC